MQYVVLGLLVVLVIGFFVVVWKAAQGWRWYNIVAVIFTMLLSVTFLFPTAGVLKSRSAWHQQKEKLEKRATQVKADQHRLKYGDIENPESAQGIISLSRQVAKMGMEAGRRWRNMQLQGVTDSSITLTVQQPPAGIPGQPPAADAAAPAVQTVPEGLVVYGFAEAPNEQQILVPGFYLGEFVVTASAPNSVTIEPTAPLLEDQQQALQDGQAASWSLYELLPLDGHAMFVAAGSVPDDDNFLGRVDDELVKKLFGDRVSEKTLQSYLRNGGRSTENDPPLSRWTKIEFDKTKSFDVDAEDVRSALDGGFFDGRGRAVDGRLQKGKAVEFKKGDQLVLKEEAANRLFSEGVAHLVDQYFLRPLNDYRYVLRQIQFRLTELESRMETLQFEQEVLQTAAGKTQKMLVEKQQIKLKLEQDFEQFRTEKLAIKEYSEVLRDRIAKMRAEMGRLHRENGLLEQQLSAQYGTPPAAAQGLATVR